MRVLFVNTTGGTCSHGRIALDLARDYASQGHTCRFAYGRMPSQDPSFQEIGYQIGNSLDIRIHGLATRLFDAHGFASKGATRKFLKWAEEFDPDILWLHNIHGYYLNVELLFDWIRSRPQMQVKWTLHDCWAFTGHCAYFTAARCDKWKHQCGQCCQHREYPGSWVADHSAENFERKKKAFLGVKNMMLITPSQWLADLTRESFLKDYPVTVRHNTINREVFKPSPSDFREKNGLENKKLLLGVASVWHERKGLRDFLKLAGMLDDSYAIVLVGLTGKQIRQISRETEGVRLCEDRQWPYPHCIVEGDAEPAPQPGNPEKILKYPMGMAIAEDADLLYRVVTEGAPRGTGHAPLILVSRTENVQELAGLYSTADLFLNPTHEENYPTTNLEAQSCGTRVITYDVGGSRETLMQDFS